MRISDCSSDGCSADLLTLPLLFGLAALHGVARVFSGPAMSAIAPNIVPPAVLPRAIAMSSIAWQSASVIGPAAGGLIYAAHPASVYVFSAILLAISAFTLSRVRQVLPPPAEVRRHPLRSEEHTSELQSLMRISYAVYCLKKT